MTLSSEIGFVASALVLAAFGMKNMINLRIVAICSNFAFIAYALVLNLPPVLMLHVILLPLNGWRLAEAFQEQHRAHTCFAAAPPNPTFSPLAGTKTTHTRFTNTSCASSPGQGGSQTCSHQLTKPERYHDLPASSSRQSAGILSS
jgi:hypothetical protein